MQRLLAYPMAMATIPFSAGIAAALNISAEIEKIQWWVLGISSIFLLVLLMFNRRHPASPKKVILHLILSFLVFTALGFFNGYSTKVNKPTVSLEPMIRMGFVKEKPKIRGSRTLLTLELLDSLHHPMNLQLWIDTPRTDLKAGDQMAFYCSISGIKKPNNPYGIDHSSILERQGIYYQGNLTHEDSTLVIPSKERTLFKWAHSAQKKLVGIFEEAGFKDENLALVSALTLGYKSDMNTDQKEAFSKSGVIHVLAVSGLHVGIVLLLLRLTFFWMHKSKVMRTLRSVLMVLGIWVFAFVSGLSPSVLRAALMFSLFVPFHSLKYRGNSYNTLATSAFILLLIQPNLLLSIGFQLSYSAVLGILLFYNPIYKVLSLRFYLLRKIWSLVAVSAAAQIGTLPLALYYFDQIPTYGLLANLVIVPLVFPFILLGGLYLLLHPVPFIGDGIAWCLNLLADIMNYLAMNISDWNGSTLNRFDVGLVDAVILSAILAGVAFILTERKKYRPILITSILITFFFTFRMLKAIDQSYERSVGIFANSYGESFAFSKGTSVFWTGDSLSPKDSSILAQQFHHVHIEAYDPIKNHGYLQREGIKILVLGKKNQEESINLVLPDILMLKDLLSIESTEVLYRLSNTRIFISSAIPWYTARRIENDLKERQLPFFNLKTNGGIIVNY